MQQPPPRVSNSWRHGRRKNPPVDSQRNGSKLPTNNVGSPRKPPALANSQRNGSTSETTNGPTDLEEDVQRRSRPSDPWQAKKRGERRTRSRFTESPRRAKRSHRFRADGDGARCRERWGFLGSKQQSGVDLAKSIGGIKNKEHSEFKFLKNL